MNRKKETYDRYAVGERIQKQRQSLGISQEALAEKIDRATKYCSDIERGICGMSVETMLSFAEHLNMSLDYMMYGIEPECEKYEEYELSEHKNDINESANLLPEPISLERQEMNQLLDQCNERQLVYARRLMEVFVEATAEEV